VRREVLEANEVAASVAELFRRARAGDFDIELCTRVDFQIKRGIADSELAAFIASVTRILPAGRWADPSNPEMPNDTLGNTVWADTPEPRPHAQAGDRIDDDIVEAHHRSGRDHLVTL
jgi:hypothetical protein